ncbi:allophanate hydrolase-related protein [Streptomyces carminius]|uniref:allophanate hydrolase-related protein n=1 Tax=Streptomyces carminius TaxID=2665496 RepID=UPI0018EBB526
MHLLATDPPKPGLRRVATGGAAVEAEVWELPAGALGRLVAALPPPMAVGPVELGDGERVPGFLCEPLALAGAPDITAHGGWRGCLTAGADPGTPGDGL